MEKREYNLYKDIQRRTNGEIYIGVVGPVRTGKSTFIKRFADLCIIPNMDDVNIKNRTIDELPQSAQGKTIMTTEPKFVPQSAAVIRLDDKSDVKVRLVDCVGFEVEGAFGYLEDGENRMVKTPWFEKDVSFGEAANIGTEKVIKEHSTISVLVTTDGTIGELERENYISAEEKTISKLKETKKPHIIVLNTKFPYENRTLELKRELEEKYKTHVVPMDCLNMQKEDALGVLEKLLFEFPVSKVEYYIPKWTQMLPCDNEVKKQLIDYARHFLEKANTMNDIRKILEEKSEPLNENTEEGDVIKSITLNKMNLSDGNVVLKIEVNESRYFQYISGMAGIEIEGEYQMINLIRQLTDIKKEYEKIKDALESVRQKGYGVVMPGLQDIKMQDPVVISHGNKYGVKMNAVSPSIHMIRANIETEIAPIVGSKEQAEDLIDYIKDSEKNEAGIWTTNIFGKSIGELMEEGIKSKILQMDDECQIKLQDTMQKIVNDANGGMICIII